MPYGGRSCVDDIVIGEWIHFYFYQGKKRHDYIYRCQIDLDDTMIPLKRRDKKK
jgi:hypothetical protein